MKNAFKRNQIVITALAIMIAAAFYLNYAGRIDTTNEEATTTSSESVEEEIDTTDISDEDVYAAINETENSEEILDEITPEGEEDIESYDLDLTTDDTSGETVVDSETTSETDVTTADATDVVSDTTEVPGEAVLTSTTTSVGFIAEAKLSREQVRSKNKETLLEIINSTAVADDQKQSAIDAMIKLTDIAERESAAEILLESKGFEDVVVSITDDTADVVVNMSEITDAKRAQIEDIMKRKTGVTAENIVITPITIEN